MNMIGSPNENNDASVLALAVGEEMLSRLDWVTIKPARVLVVGCVAEEMSAQLQKRYPDAQVECSPDALYASGTVVTQLPDAKSASGLQAQKIDLIFANFYLPWSADFKQVLTEWRRVLRPDGMLIFSALGPDTMKQWRDIFRDEHIPQLLDMHDVGDELVQQGFADPVLDVSHYTMTYGDKGKFIAELFASKMLMGQPDLSELEAIELQAGDKLSVTYEVIYGHAFVPAESNEFSASSDGVAKVPLSHLRKQLVR